MPQPPPDGRAGAPGIRAGVPAGTGRVAVSLLAAAAVAVYSGHDQRTPLRVVPARTTPNPPAATTGHTITPAVTVTQAELAGLPQATTTGRIVGAPADPDPYAATAGVVAHPTRTIPVYTRPGGQAVAALPATQLGGPTWVPVIATRPGWARTLLPARPDRVSGWIATAGPAVRFARSDYLIRVRLAAHRLTLLRGGRPVGAWPISAGTPATPTPTGRTFLLGQVAETTTHYSPVILPLGEHSTALATFDGGPATIGIHTWLPDPGVYGHDRSNGCIRVPPAGLRVLQRVPLGSLVITTT